MIKEQAIRSIPKKPVPVIDPEAFKKPLSVVESEDLKQFEEFFKRSIMDQVKDYPLPIPVVSLVQNGSIVPLLTLKSFSLWHGKQKSKKTTVLALMIAAMITGEESLESVGFKSHLDGVVLFFDTEQGESYAARTMKLILKLANLERSENLIYCDLREYSPSDRSKIIEAGIRCTPGVKMVVIDGLVDLLTDFMSAEEGHVTITDILRFCSSYDIHVAGVLHQNKADKNARAHIGTISSQKCEMEISTEIDSTDRTQSQVSCVNSRGLPFETFSIRWQKGSLPNIVQDWASKSTEELKTEQKIEKGLEVCNEVFQGQRSYTHKQSVEEIGFVSSRGETTAKTMLRDFVKRGWVCKGADEKYRRNYSEGQRVNEGQNGVNST
jgi:hypothetical protein